MPASLVHSTVEPIGTEITERTRFSLVRYKNVRERAVEQCLVEMVVRGLQTAVLDRSRDSSFLRGVPLRCPACTGNLRENGGAQPRDTSQQAP